MWPLSLRFYNHSFVCVPWFLTCARSTVSSFLSITITILDKKYKFWSSSVCNFLCSHLASSFSVQKFLFSTLFSNTFNMCCFLISREQSPTKQQGEIWFYIWMCNATHHTNMNFSVLCGCKVTVGFLYAVVVYNHIYTLSSVYILRR